MPPASMWRISLTFSDASNERSALRQRGGTAKTDSINRAGVRLVSMGNKDRQNGGGGNGGWGWGRFGGGRGGWWWVLCAPGRSSGGGWGFLRGGGRNAKQPGERAAEGCLSFGPAETTETGWHLPLFCKIVCARSAPSQRPHFLPPPTR